MMHVTRGVWPWRLPRRPIPPEWEPMFEQLRTSRNLLYNLVRRDLTVRYKSTVLGFFWSFIKPLALTAIFYVVGW